MRGRPDANLPVVLGIEVIRQGDLRVGDHPVTAPTVFDGKAAGLSHSWARQKPLRWMGVHFLVVLRVT